MMRIADISPRMRLLGGGHLLLIAYALWVFIPEFLPLLAAGRWYHLIVAAALVLPLLSSVLFLLYACRLIPAGPVKVACVLALTAGFILSLTGEFTGGGLVLLLQAATLLVLGRR